MCPESRQQVKKERSVNKEEYEIDTEGVWEEASKRYEDWKKN